MNGGLPKGWVETTFPHVALFNPKSSLDDDTEVAFVPMPHVPTNFSDTLRFEKKLWRDVKRGFTHFRNDDVIFAKITPCFENGKAAIVAGLPNSHGAGSTEFYVLRPVIVPSALLFYWVKTAAFLKTAEAHMTGTVGQKRVPKTIVESHPLPLPPLNEQKRIVAKLDAIMPRIDSAKKRLEKIPVILKRFRQSVLTAAVTGKLTEKWREEHPDLESAEEMLRRIFRERINAACTPKQKENIESIYAEIESCENVQLPETWRYSYLNKVCKSFQYGTSAKSDTQGKVPVLRMGNLQNGKIDWSNLAYTSDDIEIKKYILRKNSVLFNRTNSPELVGKTSIYEGERDAIFAGYLILIENLEELDSHYLNYSLNTSYAKEFCYREKTDGVSQSNINAQKLAHFEISLPPLEEQKEIVRQVDKLFALADKVEEHYQKAKAMVDALAQSVLAKAFRGELVPQDPDDEPAEKLLQRIREEKAKMETELKTASRSARGTRKNGAKTQRAGAEEKQASEP